MIYTVSYERLNVPYFGKDSVGHRNHEVVSVSTDDLNRIRKCVLLALQYQNDLNPLISSLTIKMSLGQ